ncbi:MAG TPA: Uma2 family endonuclease [Actinomycetota bacterium]|jgi:Uma2 family endonuclease
MASEPRTTGLTYDDLLSMFPEEDLTRRELIDGELFVTPSPVWRHQEVVTELIYALYGYAKETGGRAVTGPMDTLIAADTVLQPDVLLYRAQRVSLIGERALEAPPDLVVEVSSPSTRRRDTGAKKDKYALFGVAEYWFVDLDAERVEAFRLGGGHYGAPAIYDRGDVLTSPLLPGLSLDIDALFEH